MLLDCLQGSGDPFEMFNNLFGGGMGGVGGSGGQQRMKFNMGGAGGGGRGGGGIEDSVMGGVCALRVLRKLRKVTDVIRRQW